eukprot:403354163
MQSYSTCFSGLFTLFGFILVIFYGYTIFNNIMNKKQNTVQIYHGHIDLSEITFQEAASNIGIKIRVTTEDMNYCQNNLGNNVVGVMLQDSKNYVFSELHCHFQYAIQNKFIYELIPSFSSEIKQQNITSDLKIIFNLTCNNKHCQQFIDKSYFDFNYTSDYYSSSHILSQNQRSPILTYGQGENLILTPILFNYSSQIWDPNQRFDQKLYFYAETNPVVNAFNLQQSDPQSFIIKVNIQQQRQLWQIVTSIPIFMYEGFAKIGGMIGLITSMNIIIRKCHSKKWQRSIKRNFPKDEKLALKLKQEKKKFCKSKDIKQKEKKAFMNSKEMKAIFSYKRIYEMHKELEFLYNIPDIKEMIQKFKGK